MNHLDFSSAYNLIPVTPIIQIPSTLSNPSQSILTSSDSSDFDFPNLDHLDRPPPPPYTLIHNPPPYNLLEDLILAEVFRALFHFPDPHPFLSFSNASSFSSFPDSFFSHAIAFPPQYEPTRQSTTIPTNTHGNEHSRHEHSSIIRCRRRYPSP